MTKSECYLECSKIKNSLLDEQGIFKIMTNKSANFKIRILDVYVAQNSDDLNDYYVGIKTIRLDTNDEKETNLMALKHYYY